jgi:Uma2 family endonuclease
MPALPKIRRYTAEEYLAIDRAALTKSEYYAGEMFAMAGASEEHNIITVNLVVSLGLQLRGGPCRLFSADMRVRIGTADLYAHQDVVVVCGERRFADHQRDVLLNPTVIIEVLSEDTEAYDRGDKFAGYRQAETLQEYLLIAQNRLRIEHYIRQPDGRWLLSESDDLKGVLHLPSLGAELALSEVYDGVNFEAETEAGR